MCQVAAGALELPRGPIAAPHLQHVGDVLLGDVEPAAQVLHVGGKVIGRPVARVPWSIASTVTWPGGRDVRGRCGDGCGYAACRVPRRHVQPFRERHRLRHRRQDRRRHSQWQRRLVDVLCLNDGTVINTASIGAYPTFVQTREKLEHRIGKPLAGLYAMFHTLRRDVPVGSYDNNS